MYFRKYSTSISHVKVIPVSIKFRIFTAAHNFHVITAYTELEDSKPRRQRQRGRRQTCIALPFSAKQQRQ